MKRDQLLQTLAEKISKLDRPHPVLIGIDGVDGAGKTTLANELVPMLDKLKRKVVRASIDGFHNPREQRITRGILSPEGYFEDSFDYPFLINEFLKPLKATTVKRKMNSAKFDWKTERAVSDRTIEVGPNTIVLFEGVFLFRDLLEEFWDYKIYVKISPETSLDRGLERDAELLGGVNATREKYLMRYIPGQKIYHSRFSPELRADAVIANDHYNDPEFISLKN